MHVNDPDGLLTTRYTPGAHNTRLLNNIKKSLKYQYRMGNSTISRYMFTPDQEKYIMAHLRFSNIQCYNKLLPTNATHTVNQDKPK
jgi:hypothetical protein